MPIAISCKCGRRFRAPDQHAGKKARCPGCGAVLVLAGPQVSAPSVTSSHPEPEPGFKPRIPEPMPPAANPGLAKSSPPPALALPASTLEGSASRLRSLQRFVYLVLLLALIPLAYSTLTRNADEFSQRLERTLEAHPESREKVDELSKDEFLDLLPDHRLEGALLSADSWAHWGFALLSSGAFFAVLLVIFPRGRREVTGILAVGAFTATIGIVLLLGFQAVADWTQGTWVTGRSILVIFFYLAKFIGFSYRAALDPENGFLLSCLGFTFGVGLCEEMCKALPLLYRYKSRELPWKTACLWGLASGVGFGVSEGITYSSNFYNGIEGGGIYLVRFASCVALHAVWSGAAAIVIHRKQHLLQNADSWWHFLGTSVLLVSVPMVLHGVYDTLLKKDHEALALATALASFGWLAWQIEVIWKLYGDVEEAEAPNVPAAGRAG